MVGALRRINNVNALISGWVRIVHWKIYRPSAQSNVDVCDKESCVCECREGFEGIACVRQSCPSNCNIVGECQSLYYYYALSKDPRTEVELVYWTICGDDNRYNVCFQIFLCVWATVIATGSFGTIP